MNRILKWLREGKHGVIESSIVHGKISLRELDAGYKARAEEGFAHWQSAQADISRGIASVRHFPKNYSPVRRRDWKDEYASAYATSWFEVGVLYARRCLGV